MKIYYIPFFTILIFITCSCSTRSFHGDTRYVEGKTLSNKNYYKLDSKKMKLGYKRSYLINYAHLPTKSLPQYIVIEKSLNDPFWAYKVVYINIAMYDNENSKAFYEKDYRIPILRGINRKQSRFPIFTDDKKPDARDNYLIKVTVSKGSGHGADLFFLHSYSLNKDKLF